jgi:hypothetical protein
MNPKLLLARHADGSQCHHLHRRADRKSLLRRRRERDYCSTAR